MRKLFWLGLIVFSRCESSPGPTSLVIERSLSFVIKNNNDSFVERVEQRHECFHFVRRKEKGREIGLRDSLIPCSMSPYISLLVIRLRTTAASRSLDNSLNGLNKVMTKSRGGIKQWPQHYGKNYSPFLKSKKRMASVCISIVLRRNAMRMNTASFIMTCSKRSRVGS